MFECNTITIADAGDFPLVKLRAKRTGRTDRTVTTTPEIEKLLRAGAPVAIGVSGGKDSCALAIATIAYLDSIGHTGPRVLIHSDLGRVEWRESLAVCQRLADRLGLELIVVRRGAGDMMDRWLTRWANNVERYEQLACVKLILPWSTPSMRFCTSELKTAVICRELVKRFPGQTIVSASGIRRDESRNRAKAPVAKAQPKLASKTHKTTGIDWHPIIDWETPDVLAYLEAEGFDLHEAYTKYGMTRVSCAFCIMSNAGDLIASTTCPDNADIYREMVDLEIESTFAFQGAKWLGDVAPHLLTDEQRAGLARAKVAARQREAIEERIPEHLLYTKGWPTCIPTQPEAELLCRVRREIAAVMGIEPAFTEPAALITQYTELYQEARAREAKS
jgi:3'-phosphoadenosine 5'-phosphosulfate sulfotransferase (PAPS reductase)/FAD synthetase